MPIVFIVVVFAAGFFGVRLWNKRVRRRMLLETALSDHQRLLIAEQVPLIARLPDDLTATFEGKVNLFLDQVEFIGCNGLEITEEIQLSIAAQACLIVTNSDAWYEHLRTILVYPGAFKSKTMSHDGFVVRQTDEVRLGESWSRGPVVLSWSHTKQGAANQYDGQNLVLHEFAHQLDNLSGHTNGVPLLNERQSFAEWERVFLQAYARHTQNVEMGRKTVLDAYGAENHQEFFAVVIEVFFEKPSRLKTEEPEVYAQISHLLHLDPSSWP